MAPLTQVYYFLVLFILQTEPSPYNCKINPLAERLYQEEGSFINITYLLEVSKVADNSNFFFSLCQNNKHEYRCRFDWSKQLNSLTVRKYGELSDTFCSAELGNITWVIKISQVVSRSLAVIYFYSEDDGLQIQRINEAAIKVVLDTDPSRVTGFEINGQEVNDTHLIDEGQEVSVVCSFYKKSPSVAFRLVEKNSRKVISDVETNGTEITNRQRMREDHLTLSLSVSCADDWPTVLCEGSESAKNRSVSFLVRCTPQFVYGPFSLAPSPLENVTFRVKAHTTAFNECRLLPDPLENTFIPKMKCSLTGNPPDLVLELLLEENITPGNWTIVLSNEVGSANTSITITEESKTAAPSTKVQILIGLLCGIVFLGVASAVVIVCVKMMKKEHKTGKFFYTSFFVFLSFFYLLVVTS